jgi:hypothetical protein
MIVHVRFIGPPRGLIRVFTPFEYMPELAVLFSAESGSVESEEAQEHANSSSLALYV